MIIPVILAGGSGTRLWPMSRELYPKQLLPLCGPQTMLQNTMSRVAGREQFGLPIVVCTADHRFLVAEQVRELGLEAKIVIEPFGRDTAPAVSVAAHAAMDGGDDPVLLVLPADHVIEQETVFLQAVEAGCRHARAGRLITFGIVPDQPETGYGYIRQGRELEATPAAYAVERFVEKPAREVAESYLEAGGYYWNSGMFMFRAARFLEELGKFAPAILEKTARSYAEKQADLDFIRLGENAFEQCPKDSVDYAVMEKTGDAVVIPLDCGWNDVGSWSALWAIGKKDQAGNVLCGNVLAKDVSGCYLHAEHRLLAAVGLRDHVVVETADAVLVTPKERAQEVKSIVNQLKAEKREEAVLHRRVYRPWGSYECVDAGARFQVKRIVVKPGARLSLQMHYHRAEHWIVVKGTAKITNGGREIVLSENQSTYIAVGERHRLENPGAFPLEIIEVQSGSYLGEDDIVRFDDLYGRDEKDRPDNRATGRRPEQGDQAGKGGEAK